MNERHEGSLGFRAIICWNDRTTPVYKRWLGERDLADLCTGIRTDADGEVVEFRLGGQRGGKWRDLSDIAIPPFLLNQRILKKDGWTVRYWVYVDHVNVGLGREICHLLSL